MNLEIYKTDQYESLVEDCKAILIEGIYRSRQELIEAYKQLGERIIGDPLYKKHAKETQGKFLQKLINDIGKGQRTIYYAIQYVEKLEDKNFATALQSEGKNISWHKVVQMLPKPRKKEARLPEGKYSVIYADPPWQYNNAGISGAATNHYPTLSIEELCNLKIKDIVADNAVLFMWVTNPMLDECFKIVESWGFKYKTNIVWVKEKAGQGFYVKGQHELLLICVKGNFTPDNTLYVRSVVNLPRQEHSQKPSKFYEIIEELYPKGKYLEMFARNERVNWTSWGNEL